MDTTTGTFAQRNEALHQALADARASLAEIPADGPRAARQRCERRVDDAAAALFEANRGLAHGYARRFADQNPSHADDYHQAATVALWEACSKWDPAKGATLGGFAHNYIKRALTDAVAAAEHEVTRGDFADRSSVLGAIERLEKELGRAPTDDEVAAATGCGVARVHRLRTHKPPKSLDATFDSSDATLHDLVLDDWSPPEAGTERDGVLFDVAGERLENSTDLYIVLRVTGIDGAPPQTLASVAESLGSSRETVRKRYARCLEQLAAAGAPLLSADTDPA